MTERTCPQIVQDDLAKTKRTSEKGESRTSIKTLNGNNAKELLRSLRISIPGVKFASANAMIQEYLLYTPHNIMHELGQPIFLPSGLRHKELTEEEWKTKGAKATATKPARFNRAP